MLSRFRHFFGVVFFLLVASCSGGGCSGCGSCAGMTPLPGGFPTDRAVENAASVRVSRTGLDFLEKELGPIAAKISGAPDGKMTFPIPSSNFNQPNAFSFIIDFDVDGTICVGGPDPGTNPPRCVAEANIGAATFQIDAVTPDAVQISAVLPVQIDDTPVRANIDPGPEVTLHVGYGANGTCIGPSLERVSVSPKPLSVKIRIPLVPETTAPRIGYTKLDVDNAVIDLAAIAADDVRICADCGPLSFGLPVVGQVNLCNPVLNAGFIKTPIINALKGGLGEQLKGVLRSQLCTRPNPTLNPACPSETSPDDTNTYCVYDSDHAKCVPMLLGTDAHAELGGLLRAFSPGTTGGVDFGLASFGAMKPAPSLAANPQGRTPNGITLGMIGGVVPQPPSKCVPRKEVALPTGILIPDELSPDRTQVDVAGTPHVGIALAGRFLDYSFTSVYNSGLLCLGISTEQFDILKSGLLSLLIPSLKTLTFDQADAAAAITTRPQEAPIVKVGGGTNLDTDPLLMVTLPKLALDFYVWSFDRFARVFTYTGDLQIPVNLQVAKSGTNPNGGLVPAIGEIKVQNGALSNADTLLLDEPNIVAGAVGGLFGTVSKQLLGSGIPAIDIGSMLSSIDLNLEVNSIKKLTKGTDDYVGIFATMTKKAPAATAEAETQARLVGKRVWRDHMQAATYDHDLLPELELDLSSPLDDGKHPIEYSWWIDGGTRSLWNTTKHVVIKDDQLFVQGRHVLHVSARVASEPQTEDTTPAEIPYVIDALAPFVKVDVERESTSRVPPAADPRQPPPRVSSSRARTVAIKTWDIVSASDALVARYRVDDGAFSPWRPASELAHLDVGPAEVIEVEVEDEEGNIGTIRQPLVRGRPDPTIVVAGSGCGCSTPGANDTRSGLAAAGLALLGLGLIAQRRIRGRARSPQLTTARAALAIGAVVSVAATSQGCSCGSEAAAGTGCGADCNQTCAVGLAKGQPGAYLSVAKAKDGTIWAAGYNDALLSEGESYLWGDLVVGKYDLGKAEVGWETVDGVPTRTDGTCGPYEATGWRGGELDSGDNVGRWASLQLSAQDQPMVSYYDDTNHRLKFAINDGGWKSFVLKEQPQADIGRYSKMLLVSGKPVIAFMHVEAGNGGRTRSKVVLGRAKTELPHSAGDFEFEDIATDEDGPCRANSCPTGEACIKETGTCTKMVGGCPAACTDSQACVTKGAQAQCLAKMSTVETYPRALGAYISLANGPQGLAAVLYDGFHGNLVGLMDRGALPWERAVLDGETGNRPDKTAIDTGDVGASASLAIAPDGTWHVSYVNGTDESLRYIMVANGKPGRSEIVDDGTTVDGKPHEDGKHLVGDDSAIRIDPSRDIVTIFYADSSSLGLRRAIGTGRGGDPSRKWDLNTVPQDNKWMAFPQVVPNDDKVAVWWRQSTRASKSVEGDVLVIGP
jgi:hypothetical protein